jgi:hypothetical protein
MTPRAALVLWIGVLAACDGTGSATSSGGAGGAPSGCSIELCAPYTCDPTFETCRTTCASSSECTADHVCEAGFCVGTECTEDTAAAACGGYACVKGSCAPDCALGPCAEGFYCRGDTNECVPVCTSRGDPSCGGYVCDLEVGECESYCLDGELACAAGYACNAANECLPDSSAPPCTGDCGAYTCVRELGVCATHCVEDDDCAAPNSCVNGSCMP